MIIFSLVTFAGIYALQTLVEIIWTHFSEILFKCLFYSVKISSNQSPVYLNPIQSGVGEREKSPPYEFFNCNFYKQKTSP